jgi:Na+-transporting NADH:ubiquinone oxidoreductase subunit F
MSLLEEEHARSGRLLTGVLLLASVFLVLDAASAQAVEFPHTATVAATEALTPDTRRVRFHLPEGDTLRFSPGQFVLLRVSKSFLSDWNARCKTAHTEVARPYSFASSPSRLPDFELIVKLAGPPAGKGVPPGIGSSYVHQLKPGDQVQFSDAMGDLCALPDTGRPVIMVAGGTGAAPFLSFLEAWFENISPHKSRIYFFFGARNRGALFMHDRFEHWAESRKDFVYVPALSTPPEGEPWSGNTGTIDQVLEKYIDSGSDGDFYLAGSPLMLAEVQKVLIRKGISVTRIHHDPIKVQ